MHPRSVFCRSRSLVGLALLLGIPSIPLLSSAQDDRSGSAAPPSAARVTAERSAAAGAFSSWTMSARSDTQHAVGRVIGGYDGASKSGIFESTVEARVIERASLRASASTTPASEGLGLRLEGKLDALRQEASGMDLALAGGYEQNGFNEVAAALATVAIGRRLGGLQLLGNVSYARGVVSTEEHYGSAGLSAMYRLAAPLQLGLDSRFRIDLERDDDEPPGEREWELQGGPAFTLAAGSFAVTGGAGLAANRLRLVPGTSVGALAYLGLGAAF
jgi:hypothetical protein